MQLSPNELYHVYNRGNNRQRIFFSRDNYLFFLSKMRTAFLPQADILAYCLMPNHFHLLIRLKDGFDAPTFTNAYRNMLSSYTRAVNKQEDRTGSLFQQNSKAKRLADSRHAVTCFHYIHQNPVAASLVTSLEDWVFSSFRDYAGLRSGSLCNKVLAQELLDLPSVRSDFYNLSYAAVDSESVKQIRCS